MRRIADDRTHSAARWERAWPDPRVLSTATGAVFAGLGRITQMVSQDGTSTYAYDAKSQLTSATHSYQSNETTTRIVPRTVSSPVGYQLEQAHLLFLAADAKRAGRLRARILNCHFQDAVADAISVNTNVDVQIANCSARDCFRGGITITGGYSRILGDKPPTETTHGLRGDVFRLKSPVPGGACEWLCTHSGCGSGAVWKSLTKVEE